MLRLKNSGDSEPSCLTTRSFKKLVICNRTTCNQYLSWPIVSSYERLACSWHGDMRLLDQQKVHLIPHQFSRCPLVSFYEIYSSGCSLHSSTSLLLIEKIFVPIMNSGNNHNYIHNVELTRKWVHLSSRWTFQKNNYFWRSLRVKKLISNHASLNNCDTSIKIRILRRTS